MNDPSLARRPPLAGSRRKIATFYYSEINVKLDF
jgi:hypothetical protein